MTTDEKVALYVKLAKRHGIEAVVRALVETIAELRKTT